MTDPNCEDDKLREQCLHLKLQTLEDIEREGAIEELSALTMMHEDKKNLDYREINSNARGCV